MADEVQRHSVHTLVFRSLKRTHDMFLSDQSNLPESDEASQKIRLECKINSEYRSVLQAAKLARKQKNVILSLPVPSDTVVDQGRPGVTPQNIEPLMITGPPGYLNVPNVGVTADTAGVAYGASLPGKAASLPSSAQGAVMMDTSTGNLDRAVVPAPGLGGSTGPATRSLLPSKRLLAPKPRWHPPWKLYRVISGHTGWVRCIDVEPANNWFATGAGDRIIKIWDLASGLLKLSLTGHVSAVRALKVSPRHPYLFSCGEDKQVKCWDLEYNKVIRHYHGHLSACYDLALHPTLDILCTCGRDSTIRVWDMRTKANIHTLTGHTNTVASIATQAAEPQIISGSHDSTIRLWNLAEGRSMGTLTNHKKSVRSVIFHPDLYMFASASPDNIKQWKGEKGEFVRNLTGHNAIVNALAINREGVLVSGGDNGTMHFWDWNTGYCFQKFQAKVQPGSIDSEAGVFAMTFDQSGSRLLTAEADKTIKCYKEDDDATEETHPVIWKPETLKRKGY